MSESAVELIAYSLRIGSNKALPLSLILPVESFHSARDSRNLVVTSFVLWALVPVGEYIPLPLTILPDSFLESIPMTKLASGGQQGACSIPLPGGRQISAAGIICYDVCFTDYPREAVRQGAGLLLAASNDVWYADSSVVYQHFNHGVLRAIEYGRPMISSTNSGISAVIDDYGRVLAAAPAGSMAAAGILLPERSTPYAVFGQYLILPALLLWLAVCFLGWLWHPMYSDGGAQFTKSKPDYRISSLFHK